MATFPNTGDLPYGPKLKTYIDEGDALIPGHNHDDRYFTETEADARFAATGHNHDSRYYTETESDNKYVISTSIRNAVVLTQAAYDALTPKVATTLYVIVG